MARARVHTNKRRVGRGFVVGFVLLSAVLAGCAPGENAATSVPSAPVVASRSALTPPPALPATAPLRDQLRLRREASAAHTLFVQPDDGRAPVLDAIGAARERVYLQIYLLTDRATIHALEAAVNRGVTVKVTLEERPCCAQNNAMHRSIFAALQEARIQVQWGNPAFRLTHTKMMIVDDEQVFVMTQNLTRSGFEANREAILVSRDPEDVATARAIFAADWHRTRYTPTNPNFVVANANARATLLMLINGAGRTLDIESETMQDARIEEALLAAHRRGVAVRYIGSVPPPGAAPDTPEASAPFRTRLAGGGVGVKILATPQMHTKTIIADGAVAYIGSVNFSAASLDDNREVGILTENAAVIARLQTVFTKDWAAAKGG